jgi:hypothetical protein
MGQNRTRGGQNSGHKHRIAAVFLPRLAVLSLNRARVGKRQRGLDSAQIGTYKKQIRMHLTVHKCGVFVSIRIQYPCFRSGEPRRISAVAIGALAAELRGKLFGTATRPIDVASLMRRTARLSINGAELRIAWDCDHAVHGNENRPLLGICEHDPCEPGTILISLNRDLLEEQPALLRSTAAHELGHAIFDMPAAMLRRNAQTFTSGVNGGAEGWREWRADEFMGAFVAPRHQLARAFARCLRECGAEPRWRLSGGVPHPIVSPQNIGTSLLEAVLDSLAEQFGVSQALIGVRLRKYGFVH